MPSKASWNPKKEQIFTEKKYQLKECFAEIHDSDIMVDAIELADFEFLENYVKSCNKDESNVQNGQKETLLHIASEALVLASS